MPAQAEPFGSVPPRKPKSTYELATDVKLALATWRAQLRSRNVAATEKGIIEALVRSVDIDGVETLLSRKPTRARIAGVPKRGRAPRHS